MDALGKVLIAAGVLLVVVGGGLLLARRLPWIGRLPGDISVEREGWSFHFPIVTCIIISIVLTILLNLFLRNR